MAANQSGLGRIFRQIQGDDWIAAALDRVYAERRLEHWEPPTLEVHPSSAGSVCPRDIQLGMLGHRTPIQAKNLRRMENGTAAHDRWNRYFAAAGILGAANARLVLRDKWSGEFDILAKHPLTGKLVLVEIKTMNANRYRQVPVQTPDRELMGRLLQRVEPQYVKQLTQYYVHFRQNNPDIADEVAFLFENTDNQEFVVRYWKPDDRQVIGAFVNSDIARYASITGKLLDPPFPKQSQTCRKCYREGICYALQRGEPEELAHVEQALEALGEARARVTARLVPEQRDQPADPVVAGSCVDGLRAEEDGVLSWLDGPGAGSVARRADGDPLGEERAAVDG